MAIQTERLERLANLLDDHVRDSSGRTFDLETWGERKTRRGGFLWLSHVECGTTACAVGLACLSGQFAADGLSYIIDDGELYPIYAGLNEWSAVCHFFGLTEKQAVRLFMHRSYAVSAGPVAATAVAARIRGMLQRSARSKRPRTSAAVARIKREALSPPTRHDAIKDDVSEIFSNPIVI